VWQKNRELEAEAAATSKKKDAGEYDVVVRQLQFEMKAKVSRVIFVFFYQTCDPLARLQSQLNWMGWANLN